ncbi:MAG: DUF58 domain-containing protein [Cyclobacteriaceae bacterium]
MKYNFDEIKQFQGLNLLAKQLVEGFITGLHKSPYHGFSVEFAEHKLYNEGQSTRHIDWKVYARTDKLFTKQYEEETNLRARILLDISGSMYYPEPNHDKMRFATLATAAMTYLLNAQRDAVGLTTFSNKIESESPVKSTRANQNLIFKQLTEVVNSKDKPRTNVPQVLNEIAEKIHKRSLVIIFSDMFQRPDQFEEIFSALQHLKHRKHEIILFHISDHATELEFDFQDRPYDFIDIETNERIKLNPGDVKEQYQSQMSQYYYDLKIRCGQYKIDFVEVNTSDSIDKVLGAFLIKRKRMK